MSAFLILEKLDVIQHLLKGIFACFVSFSSEPLSLEQTEEALRSGIIVAVSAPAYTGFQIVIGLELSSFMAGKL